LLGPRQSHRGGEVDVRRPDELRLGAQAVEHREGLLQRDPGQRGLDLVRKRPDAYAGPYFESIAMRSWIKLGETDKALDMLETIMAKPFYMTPAWLRIDPMFTPLRGNPRFEKLAATT